MSLRDNRNRSIQPEESSERIERRRQEPLREGWARTHPSKTHHKGKGKGKQEGKQKSYHNGNQKREKKDRKRDRMHDRKRHQEAMMGVTAGRPPPNLMRGVRASKGQPSL